MTKLEIPSIVVQSGTKGMERTVRTQRSLSKQDEIDEELEVSNYDSNLNPSDPPSEKVSSEESSLPANNNNNTLHRSRSQNKVKLLVRSHAVREETSPPPDPHPHQGSVEPCNGSPTNEQLPPVPNQVPQQSSANRRHKLRREGSSTETWEHPPLSRGNSREQYEGGNQVDLHQFIVDTLNRNYKDRMLLLKIESDLVTLAKDPKASEDLERERGLSFISGKTLHVISGRLRKMIKNTMRIIGKTLDVTPEPHSASFGTYTVLNSSPVKFENCTSNVFPARRSMHKFAQMSSYQRMLVHRVAAYFNMEHNVDTSGVSVIVNTTKATRIPETRFREFVRDDLLLPEEPRRSILKRDSSSFDETGSFKSGERMLHGDSRRSKSFEEREEEYEKARRRIFNREHSGDGDVDCMDELHWETEEGVCTQCEHPNNRESRNPPRLLKVESYESGDTLRANSLRLSVSKSHSFNGYEPPQQTRILTKQDSGSSMSSRISPSSSGYKSQRSDATLSATPSPTATPNLHTQLSGQSGGALSPEPDTVVWAVSDLASVPPGSMLIHPQTGQPYTNADGSIYHYDPANPPRVAGEIHQGQTNPPMNGVPPTSTAPQQKHESLDNSMANANVSSQQQSQQHSHEINSKGGVVDSGYDSGGSNGYLAPPPPLCPAPQPQFHPPHILQPTENGPPPQYHPVVYPVQPTPAPPHVQYQQYDPRMQEGNPSGNNDLSGYMMGLSLDGSKQPDTRQVMYWQPHHLQSHSSLPVYYNTGPGSSRYQGPPPPSQLCPTPQAYMPPPPPPPPQAVAPQPPPHFPPEHSGCYGAYSNGGPECIPYASSAVHMYYTPPYNGAASNNGSQNNGGTVGNGGPGYYGTNVANCPAPILALQYPQPCPHPTPPHTPQGVCGQFAVYNGCYSSHYAQPSSSLPVPQLFRKPTLQVGVRCGSPMRPQYPVSPTVKERSQDEKMQPVPVYGFRVLPGDMRLLGNTGRIPFALPAPAKNPHARKHRSKIGSSQGRNGGQQSIEVTTLHAASKA